jgi:hypothetical protein
MAEVSSDEMVDSAMNIAIESKSFPRVFEAYIYMS